MCVCRFVVRMRSGMHQDGVLGFLVFGRDLFCLF